MKKDMEGKKERKKAREEHHSRNTNGWRGRPDDEELRATSKTGNEERYRLEEKSRGRKEEGTQRVGNAIRYKKREKLEQASKEV